MDSLNLSDVYAPSQLNQKRLALIRSLPAEHQNHYVDPDRFILAKAKNLVGKRHKDFEKVKFRDRVLRKVRIFTYEGVEPLNDKELARLHALSVVAMYSASWEEPDPNYLDTFGVIISILASYVPSGQLLDNGLIKEMNICGASPVFTIFHTKQELHDGTREAIASAVREMQMGDFEEYYSSITVVAMSLLILIGKNITEQGRQGWFTNRWRAISNVMAKKCPYDKINPPQVDGCFATYNAFSANTPMRAFVFRVIRSLSAITDKSFAKVFDRIMMLLQWAEMSHIWMIAEYIGDMHPDILNFPQLSGPELSALMVAFKFIKQFPPEDRPYIKLLHDHNSLKPLHSRNFVYYIAAAHAIGSTIQPSKSNMNVKLSEDVKAFQNQVKEYIRNKNRIGSQAAASSFGLGYSPEIRERLMRAVETSAVNVNLLEFEDTLPKARE